MKAVQLVGFGGPETLVVVDVPTPEVGPREVLIRVKASGVNFAETAMRQNRYAMTPPLPSILGSEVAGIVEAVGAEVEGVAIGDRVAGSAFAAGQFFGGYAEYMVVPERFAYTIPDLFTDAEAAPLLCAGAIGYRSLALCNMSEGKTIGLTGFGASAHLVLKLIRYQYPQSEVYVFARNPEERAFALELGAQWAGDTSDMPPYLPDCIIDTTPVWEPAVRALECLKPGGRLVINAIRKESADKEYLLHMDYARHLWMEKEIKSVANVTSHDVREFIRLAAEMPFKPEVEIYPFEKANQAILDIKQRKIKGAKVLVL